jgi:hypothetical protein
MTVTMPIPQPPTTFVILSEAKDPCISLLPFASNQRTLAITLTPGAR